jgi:HEXXH motif-containing protein
MNYTNHSQHIERSYKFRLLKMKGLLSTLRPSVEFDRPPGNNQAFLDALQMLKSRILVASGTDFFWASVHRACEQPRQHNRDSVRPEYIYFLINSFDSYFSHLPLSTSLTIRSISGKDILLPRLGIHIRADWRAGISISKVDDNVVRVVSRPGAERGSRSYDIRTHAIDSKYLLRRETITPNISVLCVSHDSLFEKHYIKDCCTDSTLVGTLTAKIIRAFKIIQGADDELYKKLITHVEFIVAYGNDPAKRYPNFAIATLTKTLFLSINIIDATDLHCSECLIHEYSHCELHVAQETEPLVSEGNALPKHYSPWRSDPRPILGVLHGMYVADAIISFYALMLSHRGAINRNSQLVRHLLAQIIHQLLAAIDTLDLDQLTPFARKMAAEFYTSAIRNAQAAEISLTEVPSEVSSHFMSWIERNQELARTLKVGLPKSLHRQSN